MTRALAALPAALAVLLAACAQPGVSAISPVPVLGVKPASIDPAIETQMTGEAAKTTLDLVNRYRAALNLAPLKLDQRLTEVAYQQALAMAGQDAMGHDVIGDLASRLKAKGITNVYAGENLGRNYLTAGAMFSWWANSPVHAGIMAMKPLTRMGLAMVVSPKSNRPYWALALASGG